MDFLYAKSSKKLKVCAVFYLFLLGGIYAQETVPVTGGELSGSGVTVTYSVGQVTYTTNTGANGSVVQGVLQPFEISITLGVEIKDISLNLSVYPNPTANYLNLKIKNSEFPLLTYYLFDIQGKLIEKNKTAGNKTAINMINLPSGTYFLKIMDTHKVVKTFKIIKN